MLVCIALLNTSSLGFALHAGHLKDWIGSNLLPNLTNCFAMAEAEDFASACEVTEDCAFDFRENFEICSDIHSLKQQSVLSMYASPQLHVNRETTNNVTYLIVPSRSNFATN